MEVSCHYSGYQEEQKPEVHGQLITPELHSTPLQSLNFTPVSFANAWHPRNDQYILSGDIIDDRMNECCQYVNLVSVANTSMKQMPVADELAEKSFYMNHINELFVLLAYD